MQEGVSTAEVVAEERVAPLTVPIVVVRPGVFEDLLASAVVGARRNVAHRGQARTDWIESHVGGIALVGGALAGVVLVLFVAACVGFVLA